MSALKTRTINGSMALPQGTRGKVGPTDLGGGLVLGNWPSSSWHCIFCLRVGWPPQATRSAMGRRASLSFVRTSLWSWRATERLLAGSLRPAAIVGSLLAAFGLIFLWQRT